MSALCPNICVVNGPGVDQEVPKEAVYGFQLKEVKVKAERPQVLKLQQGSSTGCVAAFKIPEVMENFSLEYVFGSDAGNENCCRQFGVSMPISLKTVEVSWKSVADAKAVLVINGTLDGGSSIEDFQKMVTDEKAVEEMGNGFGSQPGCICKHILFGSGEKAQREGVESVIGGCYFFESVADVETYLESDFWQEVEKTTAWTDVRGEVFEVVGP